MLFKLFLKTVLICCESVSDFGKVLVLVLARVPDPDNIKHNFQQQNICTKSCLFNVRSSIISQKVGLSFLYFVTFLHFILDPDRNPDTEPEPDPEPEPYCIPVPAPLRQKVMVSAVPVHNTA
jgi:hypothetical protein